MTERNLLLGPPGCGKTHTLIEMVRARLESGVRPDRIGYVSFTRKAVEEARQRAASSLGLTPDDTPFFKTLHALSYSLLGLSPTQLMSREDWAQVSAIMGVEVFDEADEEGQLINQFSMGTARYLSVLNRAKMRRVSVEQEFSDRQDYTLKWGMQISLMNTLETYLRDTGKYTFVSMLEAAAERAPMPHLDLLIVDEAQDLVPLQWALVERLASNAREVWFAGDDDQAIHRWAGVDTSLFLSSGRITRVLDKSFRLPKPVHAISQKMIRRVGNRVEKRFRPADHGGFVGYCMSLQQVDMGSGSWSVMARTRGLARLLAEELRSGGHYVSLFGRPSIDQEKIDTILLWEALQQRPISVPEARRLYRGLPKQGPYKALRRGSEKLLDMLAPDAMIGHADLMRDFGLLAPAGTNAETVAGLPEKDRIYLRSLRRRGEDIGKGPRIKVSTMHAMKGGEDDNVVLYLGTSALCARSKFPDDEVRTFYVGATRARQRLFLVASSHRHRFEF
jgi:superfamily I DNA/RNA helicase